MLRSPKGLSGSNCETDDACAQIVAHGIHADDEQECALREIMDKSWRH